MLPFAWYLLKVATCSGILYGYYWLLLRNKAFHQYNRFYLLTAVLVSLVLPLVEINWQPVTGQETTQVVKVLQAVAASNTEMDTVMLTKNHQQFDFQLLYPIAYLLVTFFLLAVFIRTLYLIHRLLKQHPQQQFDGIRFINTSHKSTPFSFLDYIFWNDAIDIGSTQGRQIFEHELAHVKEKHTYDKLFINGVLIVCWINPFFWLIRKELAMIHEFIADKKALEGKDISAFATMILQAAYPGMQFPLANNFFYSPIKRRILMLTKKQHPRVNYIARLMVLPLAAVIVTAFTLKSKNSHPDYNGKKITVVIDAGHGGSDAGAMSADGLISEKDLNLAFAKKIKELNSNENINIILTREDDHFASVQEKSAYASKQQPDLFISMHVDNSPKGEESTHSGLSVWVAKDEYSNAAQSKVLASAIISEFSGNYPLPVMSTPSQRKEGIWILQNNYPSILIETGYINNEKDIAYLQTTEAKETIAKNILAAIEKFAWSRQQYNAVPSLKTASDTVPVKEIPQAAFNKAQPIYYLDGVETDKSIIDKLSPGDIAAMHVLKNPEDLKPYGEKGKNGIVIISTKKHKQTNQDPVAATDNMTRLKPHIYVGDLTKPNVDMSLFKKQKEITTTAGYSFVSATLYFSGKGFNTVQIAQLNGKSLEPLQSVIGQCIAGSAITFDNIYVKENATGKTIEVEGCAYILDESGKLSFRTNKGMELVIH